MMENPTPPDRTRGLLVSAGVIAALFAALVAVALSSAPSAPERTVAAQPLAAAAVSSPSNYKPIDLETWIYSDDRDGLTDRATPSACVQSLNRVSLPWPYHDVLAKLCIRRDPRHGLSAAVQLIGEGQILCRSYDQCSIPVRFGDRSAVRFSGTGPSDGSSNVAFLLPASRVIDGLRRAEQTRVELSFYQAGNQVLIFKTAGLVWPPKP